MYREHATQPISAGHETVVLDPAAHETMIFPQSAAAPPRQRGSALRAIGLGAGALLLVAVGAFGGAMAVSANTVSADEAAARVEQAQQRGYEDGFRDGSAEAAKNAAAKEKQAYRDGYQQGMRDGSTSLFKPSKPAKPEAESSGKP